jgi:hypothetical protein
VDGFEIESRTLRWPLLVVTIGEQGLFKPLIVAVVRQLPAKSGSLGTLQVVIYSGLANRATARDLPLPQSPVHI